MTALERVEGLSKVERQWRAELFAKLRQADEPSCVQLPLVCPCLVGIPEQFVPSGGEPKGVQKGAR